MYSTIRDNGSAEDDSWNDMLEKVEQFTPLDREHKQYHEPEEGEHELDYGYVEDGAYTGEAGYRGDDEPFDQDALDAPNQDTLDQDPFEDSYLSTGAVNSEGDIADDDSDIEGPEICLAREQMMRQNLFANSMRSSVLTGNVHDAGIVDSSVIDHTSGNRDYYSSVYTGCQNRGYTQSSTSNISQNLTHNNYYQNSGYNPQYTVTHSHQERLSALIEDYIKNPSDIFTIKGLSDVTELPDIMKSLTSIKKLIAQNCGLRKLKNLPPKVEVLDLRYNDLTELMSEDIPDSVSDINAHKNKITHVDLSGSNNIKTLNVSNNPLYSLFVSPPNVEKIFAGSTHMTDTEPFINLKFLRVLKINSTFIDNIDAIPDTIEELYISRARIENSNGFIKKLPKNLVKLVAQSAGISKFLFPEFPENLKECDLYDNSLTELPKFPSVMSDLDFSKNNMTRVLNLPDYMENFDGTNNSNLVYTAEQKATLDRLDKHAETNIKYQEDDDDDFMSPFNYYRSGYRDDRSGYTNYRVGNTSSLYQSATDTVTEMGLTSRQDAPPSHQESSTAVSTYSSRQFDDQSGQRGRSTNSYFDSMMNRKSNMAGQNFSIPRTNMFNRASFGTLGNSNCSGTSSYFNTSSHSRYNKPPDSILKFIRGDNFTPSRKSTHRIRHANIYYV